MKKGELEAKEILEKLGEQFDEDYHDDNSKSSMPDLRYKNGRYLEVTHTRHNNAIFTSANKFSKKSITEQLEIEIKAADAIERMCNSGYGKDNTEKKQCMEDCKLLKSHMGYDATFYENKFNEFKCDIPMSMFSAENIMNEITKDKGKKYPNGDTDLFIFAAFDEFKFFWELLEQYEWNGYSRLAVNQIFASPFQVIYICSWDIERQKYNILHQKIKKIVKINAKQLKIETFETVSSFV